MTETWQDGWRQLLTWRQGAGWGYDTDPVLPPELLAPFYHDPIKCEPREPPFVRQQAATYMRSRLKTQSKTEPSSSNQLRLEGKSSRHHGTALVMNALHKESEKQPKVNSPHTRVQIATNVLLRVPSCHPPCVQEVLLMRALHR